MAKRTLGKIHHARWVTLALRINFLHIPSAELFRLCWFVINVYSLLWFTAKRNWRATEGPLVTFEAMKLINMLPADEKRIVVPVFQRGFGNWAHSEQLLLACLSSDDADIRSRAVAKIIQIRDSVGMEPKKKKKKVGVRIFKIPTFIFNAKDFTSMINWEDEQMTEPPYTMQFNNEELRQFETRPLILNVPSNSQFVERHIRVITENGRRAATPVLRDGLAHATMAHRQLRGKKETKADFSRVTPS